MVDAALTTAKKKEMKKKKKKKRRHEEESNNDKDGTAVGTMDDDSVFEEKTKKKGKSKKRKRKSNDDTSDADIQENCNNVQEESVEEKPDDDGDGSNKNVGKLSEKEARAARRAERRAERKRVLSQLPTANEHGVAYTKQQLRRMRKRVQRGLDPVETPAEKHERLKQDALMRRQEEAELAGEELQQDTDEEGGNGGGGNQGEGDDASNGKIVNEEQEEQAENIQESATDCQQQEQEQPRKRKPKRSKPVPADYICNACNNTIQPIHWIYDCPIKKTMPGTNQISKKKKRSRPNANQPSPADNNNNSSGDSGNDIVDQQNTSNQGLHDPDARKVFVSGLPFDAGTKDVKSIFEDCGTLVRCKLIRFEDTGRCTGQAYLTFDSERAARAALKLTGTILKNDQSIKTNGDDKNSKKRRKRELTLTVTKTLNRFLTKKRKLKQ